MTVSKSVAMGETSEAATAHPRHDCRRAPPLRAVVEVSVAGKVRSVLGEVCDLSKSGAKLLLAADLSLAESVTVRLLDEQQDTLLSAEGKVCWSRPSRDGRWRIGCAFDCELRCGQLAELAEKGYVERRQHARCPLLLKATAQWELDAESFPVEFEDVSAGGFCVVCVQAPRQRERLRVSVDSGSGAPGSLLAVAKWHVKVENGFLLGCEFVDRGGSTLLQQMLGSLHGGSSGEGQRGLASALASAFGADASATTSAAMSGPANVERLIARAYRRLAVAAVLIVLAFVAVACGAALGPLGDMLVYTIGLAAATTVWRFCAAMKEASVYTRGV